MATVKAWPVVDGSAYGGVDSTGMPAVIVTLYTGDGARHSFALVRGTASELCRIISDALESGTDDAIALMEVDGD